MCSSIFVGPEAEGPQQIPKILFPSKIPKRGGEHLPVCLWFPRPKDLNKIQKILLSLFSFYSWFVVSKRGNLCLCVVFVLLVLLVWFGVVCAVPEPL